MTFESSNPNTTVRYSVPFQLIFGLVFAALNFVLKTVQYYSPIPLYLDTVFTITASFFGALCGTVCSVIFHTMVAIHVHNPANFFWVFCSLTIVLIIRVYLKKREQISVFGMVFLIIIVSVIIGFEGSVLFVILNTVVQYKDDSPARIMYHILMRSNFPIFVSAFLPRIPMNILDKTISFPLGYAAFLWIKKIRGKVITRTFS